MSKIIVKCAKAHDRCIESGCEHCMPHEQSVDEACMGSQCRRFQDDDQEKVADGIVNNYPAGVVLGALCVEVK